MIVEVVAAAIFGDKSVFAAQRNAKQSHAGAWEFPGGKVEVGETHAEALRRELREEFGIQGHVGAFIATQKTEDPDRSIHVHLYRVYVEETEIVPREHAAVAWLKASELTQRHWTQADQAFLPKVEDIMASKASLWEQSPESLDALPTRASGQHIFAKCQRPWTYVSGKPEIGHLARKWLDETFDVRVPEEVGRLCSQDGTTRLIYAYPDGARVETIHMPRDVRSPRVTLCISSQVGCPMGCAFCATAKLGFRRNLTAGELVAQVLQTLKRLGPEKPHAINLVFMGMGEALCNAANVSKAVEILCDPRGLGIPERRITLSTCGLLSALPLMLRWSKRPNLAVSLNATTNASRNLLMPINKQFPLEELHAQLVAWPLRSHEKILIEYVLLKGINDSDEDAHRLIDFVKDIKHNINIIPYNSIDNSEFCTPTHDEVEHFMKILQDNHCLATLRVPRGVDVGGACGQLLGFFY